MAICPPGRNYQGSGSSFHFLCVGVSAGGTTAACRRGITGPFPCISDWNPPSTGRIRLHQAGSSNRLNRSRCLCSAQGHFTLGKYACRNGWTALLREGG